MSAVPAAPEGTPPERPLPVVFHGVSFNAKEHTTRSFTRADLDRELNDPAVFSWIDIQAPDIAPLNDVLRRWNIDLRLVSHFEEPEILPRIVERSDSLAFYLYEIEDPERHLDTSQGLSEIAFARMILVLGSDFVITYHRGRLDAVDEVKSTAEESFRLVGKSPAFVAFLFLQACLYDYAHLNLANDNALDRVQDRVGAGEADGVEEAIAIAGTNILTLKKLVASIHIVLMRLATKRSPFISNEARASFNDMLQNATAVRAAVDSSRDLLDGIVGSLQAAAAARTSDIARVLTVISGILLPLTVITGIYGMNFEHMPELRWPFGYFGVLALMAGVATGLLLVFRRLGWIGARAGSR
ncbi:MAG TPA: magnesium transporter CorA family protein, partial [Vicinamibacteria bacterium]|nr:magnesium transporter CorA family protein [Vicinamibacteria bacterium]